MPRTYSFDHFQAKKPQQSVVGSPDRLGNPEDKQKPLKHELPEQGGELPGTGGLHYGREHAETVKRFKARRVARQKAEASRQRTAAKKAAPQKKKVAAERPAPAPRKTAAKKAAPARATSPQAPREKRTTTQQGILSRPIRKVASVASGVKRLATQAVAARLGRSTAKPSTEKKPDTSSPKGKGSRKRK